MPKIIAHLDMDAFFASVEERDNPWMKGKPIVVGSDPKEGRGRGVVSASSYAARRLGIFSATPITRAWQISEEARKRGEPEVIFWRPSFRKYGQASRNVMAILSRYSPKVIPSSIDEAYFDLTFCRDAACRVPTRQGFQRAEDLCRKVKEEILSEEKLTCSIGIGPNKMIAKIASDFQKPDGLTVVPEGQAEKFLAPMDIRKIPGVGPKAERALLGKGIRKIGDAKGIPAEELVRNFGKLGEALYEKARGRGSAELEEETEQKSIGQHTTFERDTRDPAELVGAIEGMAREVLAQFQEAGFSFFRTVVITVRLASFRTFTRSHTLEVPAATLKPLKVEALRLFMPFLDKRENPQGEKIRLVGVRIEKLG